MRKTYIRAFGSIYRNRWLLLVACLVDASTLNLPNSLNDIISIVLIAILSFFVCRDFLANQHFDITRLDPQKFEPATTYWAFLWRYIIIFIGNACLTMLLFLPIFATYVAFAQNPLAIEYISILMAICGIVATLLVFALFGMVFASSAAGSPLGPLQAWKRSRPILWQTTGQMAVPLFLVAIPVFVPGANEHFESLSQYARGFVSAAIGYLVFMLIAAIVTLAYQDTEPDIAETFT